VRYHAGRGLLAGLEFSGPLEADKVVQKCRDKGLLTVSTGRKWVKLGPAFTITDEDLEKGCKILKEAIDEVKNETHRDSGEGHEQGGSVLQEPGVSPSGGGAGEVERKEPVSDENG
jgi:hypothetical protein